RTQGRPLSELPSSDENGKLRFLGVPGQSPVAVVLGSPPVRATRGTTATEPRIELPPTGVIEVEYDYGERFPESAKSRAHTTLVIEPAGRDPFDFDGEWTVRTRIQDGRATLFAVALGQQFLFQVPGRELGARLKVDGPTQPGEVVQVRLSPDFTPRLRCRVVDEAGAPLVDREIRLLDSSDAWRRGWSLMGWEATSNEKGEVTFRLDGLAGGDVPGELFIEAARTSTRGGHELVGQRTVEEPLPRGEGAAEKAEDSGVLDIGTWTLHPRPKLVSGRVVDLDGNPVAQARVRVISMTGSNSRARSSPLEGTESALSNKDGTFTIRRFHPPSNVAERKLALKCYKDEMVAFELVPFSPGDHDVTVMMSQPSGIRVDLTDLDPLGLTGLRFTLEGGEKELELQPGRLIELKHQRPGSYRLVISYPPESVALADNLVLHPGETLLDSRLNPVSLNGFLHRPRIFVSGSDGKVLDSIMVGRVRAGMSDRTSRIEAKSGVFDVLAYLAKAPESYWIEADGYRRAAVDVLRNGMSIELQTAIQVTVQLVGADLPGVPMRMSARSTVSQSTQPRDIPVIFDATGRGTFEASQPGPYVLKGAASIGRRAAASSSSASRPWEGASLSVTEAGGELEVVAVRGGSPAR
ncbi:MAG: carboxypeptidase-like regulatory domain-containing protein, partial [Planctomycetota bacterium]